MDNNSVINYANYLFFIQGKLNGFFEKQKPYIKCEKGCAKCCKNAEFPYSEVEIKYLMIGFSQLSQDVQDKITDNIQKTIDLKRNSTEEEFKYDCPFLIDDVCSVYPHRGLICRAFGLLTNGDDGRMKVPFCCFEGYNYSNVVDYETKTISKEKYDSLNEEQKPVAFNTSYKFLTHEDFARGFEFEFGEKKQLIDWFMDKKI